MSIAYLHTKILQEMIAYVAYASKYIARVERRYDLNNGAIIGPLLNMSLNMSDYVFCQFCDAIDRRGPE